MSDQVLITAEDIDDSAKYSAEIVYLSGIEENFNEESFQEDEAVWQMVTFTFRGDEFYAKLGDSVHNENNDCLFLFKVADIKSLHVNLPHNTSTKFKSTVFIFVAIETHMIIIQSAMHDIHLWCTMFHASVHIEKSGQEHRSFESISNFFSHFRHIYDSDNSAEAAPPKESPRVDGTSAIAKVVMSLSPPPMNIAILVVGTRGDVQPFVYFGQALQRKGHRVRLATHSEYRADVALGGLEFYPLEGDPHKLSEYMVKTGGRLMPDLLNRQEMKA